MTPLRLAALLLLPLSTACAAAGAPPVGVAVPAFHSDRIQVTVVGSGPDVILIPGLSSSPGVWASTVAAVPGYRYHLVQVDGFAGAPADANATGPVVAPVADEIARYIAAAKLDRPALVGHSLGGTLAMMVAARHPDAASKVMVVDMMPFMGAMFAANATPASVAPVAAQIRDGIAASSGPARDAMTRQTIAGMVRTKSLRAGPIADSLASDPKVSGQAMYDLVTTDLRPELAAIVVPLTVLWAYPSAAPISAERMAEFYRLSYANAPSAALRQVPDSAHFIMLDALDRFRRELRDFLTAKPGGPAKR